MGEERDNYMYEYVSANEIKEFRSYCDTFMKESQARLRNEYGIRTRFDLIGSGGRNMVTRNGDGPYDLDYNINIISMPDEYWDDLKRLKEIVISELNCANRNINYSSIVSYGKDSTSVITYIFHSFLDREKYKVDIGICSENKKGNWQRLIHDKNTFLERFYWNEKRNSNKIEEKVKEIKAKHRWGGVRDEYLRIKNRFLSRQDNNHPSFICYVEAVNHVYDKLTKKKK